MESLPFAIEYHSDGPELTDVPKAKIENRLAKLVHKHHDLTGASVSVQTVSGDTLPHTYRARLVLYRRPNNVAAVTQGTVLSATLDAALDAAMRQVRDRRDRHRTRRKHA